MNDSETFAALVSFHLRLGYDREASIRLALWCLDASRGMYPELETP